ncbi:autophagy-related protein 2 homolog A [Aplochiton taeniatus]
MSRWLFPWSGSIKKRACRYLLQHYLGHFLQERLSLEQLSLDLYNGSGVIKEIHLDVWAVNELLESLGAPLEIVDGFICSISVTIPWQALVTDHCTLVISGLQITCRPKYRTSGGWDSQGWSNCMTSSMQLAQECLKDPPEESEEPPAQLEGLEMFAQTIETVLRRIKVTFLDTIVRIEHQPLDREKGIALEVHIKRLEYCDEAVRDPGSQSAVPVDIHQPPAFLHKILQLSAVQLLYENIGGPPAPLTVDTPDPVSSSDGEEEDEEEEEEEEEEDDDDDDDDDDQEDEVEEEMEDERPAARPTSPPPTPPQPLLIGSCSGFMETTVKIKQNEMLPGPKLELDGKVGCLHLLLSPDQITNLTDLLSALCIDTEPEGKGAGGGHSRPLDSEDLRLIEEDLSKQLSSSPGDVEPEWDTEPDLEPYLSGLENGDMFFSMGPGGMTSSMTSVRSGSELSDSDMESSTHSQASYTQGLPLSAQNCPRRYPVAGSLSSLPQCRPKGRSHSSQAEPLKPDALMRLTLGGLTLTLLEEDPPPSPDGTIALAEVSQTFFRELAFFKDSMFSERDFQHLRASFARACPHSHLRITGAAVQVACEMRSGGRHARAVTSDLSFSRLELLECLWESAKPQYTELLQFQRAGLFTVGATARPCAQLHYSLTEKHLRKGKQRVVRRDSLLRVELGELSAEWDLDFLSRLGALSQAFSQCPVQTTGPVHTQMQASELRSSLCLLSPHATLRLRFPIPDLRPPSERRPLNLRVVRDETLVLELCDLELRHQEGPDIQAEPSWAGSGQPPGPSLTQLLEASFSDLHGTYEGWAGGSFPCIRVQRSQDSLARLSVRVSGGEGLGSSLGGVGAGLMRDLGSMSFENPCELREKTGSPFSSNRTMFETEEMVIPADPEEMLQFQSQCVSQCQCVVDIMLPLAYILLPSKQGFQSIYNRINNDLLMWEAPPPPPSEDKSPHPHRRHQDEEFQLCKSAFRLDSDSEEDEPQFYSASESARRKQPEARPKHNLSLLSLTVFIKKGRLQALTDSKEDQNHGEIVLDLEGGKIFSVAQHQNNPHLNFLCIESRRVELHHKAVVKNTPVPERLEMPSFTASVHLDPTIYPTEAGVTSASGRESETQMLSTAIKITLDPKRNVKEFLVALRLQGATMRHYMAQTNHSWHEQLVDFLDVIDDPIMGYTSPAVITVLHTHLATCAVDYRPLYLPLRVLFTAESFSLSSNIIVDTATFHLRFILDDSALYLSDKCESDTVDLRRDYVCILDIDLLELAITTWKGSNSGKLSQPLFELRCSNNMMHVHTCADSCAALVNLLQYLVSQGDLHPPPKHTSPTEIAGQKLPMSENPASLPPCPPAETAEINQYDLADALIDTERSHRDNEIDGGSPTAPQGSPVSVYLFPGEAPKLRPAALDLEEECELDGLVATATEAQADAMSEEGSEGSTDNDDFCILEAPGMGIPSRDGEPLVTVLAQDPIRVKKDHFSRPRGSSDLLRAPSRFPVPQSRVVLKEVSIVWHLYGGKDFGGKPMTAHSQHGVNRARSTSAGMRGSPSRSAAPSRPQNSWRWAGGCGRQHTLLMEIQLTKVSFQHESYKAPVSVPGQEGEGPGVGVGVGLLGEQPLSRQVFIVQELEVRDRLASSQLNKFLYLYTSESMPRRAHSNMLTVKALQVSPESGLGGPECCLRISLLPLRLNIDQDALFFLKDFFSSLAAGINPYLPVDSATEVKVDPSQKPSEEAESDVALGPDLAASVETTYSEQSSSSAGSSSSSDQPIYFREFRFTSEVPIWLDYQGKHMVIEQGTFAGILIGLAQLNCSELKLKRLCCRHGLLGVDKVIQYAVTEWLTDIRKNQLPGILGGVGPMHSVVQLFHGVRDLFWMPIEQYRRDGRIIRGLQRGAASFGTSTASAALELSNRLVQAIQATAETVYDILSPTPPLTRYAITEGRPASNRPRRAPQPADLREGVAKAYDTVREGVIDTAQTLCDVASRGHEQKGLPGAVGGVLRQIPPTVVRPLIVASEATSNLLGGMRNQIKPDARKEDFLKWRTEDGQE